MVSGNFVVGYSMELELFDEYVLPALSERGCFVPDRLDYQPLRESGKRVFISLVGEGDLEKTLNDTLVELGDSIEGIQEERERKGKEKDAYPHNFHTVKVLGKPGEETVMKGIYEVEGVYDSDATASRMFPILAQRYLLVEVGEKADKVRRSIRALVSKPLSQV